MEQNAHWTSGSIEAFIHRIAFDFIAQLDKKMESLPLNQAELAKTLGVSEGAVSQVLNDCRNPNLKTIVKYARALGMKVAIVAYDDDDPENRHGPVGSEIFAACWEKSGKPFDLWSLKPDIKVASTTFTVPSGVGSWQGTVNALIELNVKELFISCKTGTREDTTRIADYPRELLKPFETRSTVNA